VSPPPLLRAQRAYVRYAPCHLGNVAGRALERPPPAAPALAGYFTLLASQFVDPRGRVVAIEPRLASHRAVTANLAPAVRRPEVPLIGGGDPPCPL
jgi:hypothetical protein